VMTYGLGVTVEVKAAELDPVEFVATTEKRSSVSFVKPMTVQPVAGGVIEHVNGPGSGFHPESNAVTV